MKRWLDGVGYYLSCMVIFNLLYLFNIINKAGNFKNSVGEIQTWLIVSAIMAGVLSAIGIACTVLIVRRDDSLENTASTGKVIEVSELVDATGENYFANFSVIVLTGIALPIDNSFWCMLIFLLVEISLGIVYIKKTLVFMNPVLSLLDYSIYFCVDKKSKKKYVFVIKGDAPVDGGFIRYKNINAQVIRLGTLGKGYQSIK